MKQFRYRAQLCGGGGLVLTATIFTSQRFVRSSVSYGLIFPLFHRHVSYMLESRFTQRKDRTYFNSLASYAGVLDWLDQEGLLDPPQVTAISNGVAGI